MQRKVFDLIASAGGAVMVIVLVVAGVLLMWGYSFANSNVHNQLAEQQIVFPAKSAFAHPSRAVRSPHRWLAQLGSTQGNRW